ncbi:hypothetical protein [Capillimicrobium parvum]|uniref:Uncharacterized protein n=1 Tax=Capillimicrobium parvum TaxID=2884022 RepID=A0A9E7BZ86_9ACTN|nr:hypothetical protein [Capillimicrobium parvum]UGS34242.1 hypothetical protein DSM104329_00618 [Capillimicrobium parvum]
MTDDDDRLADPKTDDAKLYLALLEDGMAQSAWWVARKAGVGEHYAMRTLASWADNPNSEWQVIRRDDLGPEVYEAVEDSARRGDA